MIIKVFFYLFIIVTNMYSYVTINENSEKLSIIKSSNYYIDISSKLGIEQVDKQVFKKNNDDYIKLGYSKDTLWLRFEIRNDSNTIQKRHLIITNPILDTIELYEKIDGFYIKKTLGKLHSNKNKAINTIHPNFEITIEEKQSKVFYLKTYSLSSANYYQLYLEDSKEMYTDEFTYQLILTLFFGAMIALIIYNIFIYIFTKEINYLYYVLYISFVVINHLSYSGMFTLILKEEYSQLDAFKNLYYICFATIFSLLFINNFLNISKFKKLNIITSILIILNIFIMIISSKEAYFMEFASILVTISVLYILFLSFYSFYKKNYQAKYILLGWVINIIGVVSISLKQHGISNPIDTFAYFYETTAFLEAILFSIALASRLNRTKELESAFNTNQILLKELHHRVKNSMQFIILLYRLKLSKLITPQIDEKLQESENAIQAMSQVHETLYSDKNLDNINTKEYFIELISKLEKSFDLNTIKINLNINSTLNLQQSIYCGIILNELITNAFKYAFINQKGKINISLKQIDKKFVLKIEDNGIGFEIENRKKDTFGLSFVEAMVKDELKGNIEFRNDNGLKIQIIF